ncbi:MAG: hypothetical protein C0606_02920 [Hyphomicrobiales bacterium]|nr:MAG: hypothetical protein C0606_02920 [Hyphomicrobiales bacterium]
MQDSKRGIGDLSYAGYIRLEAECDASAEIVWDCLVDGAHRAEWGLEHLQFEHAKGGALEERWTDRDGTEQQVTGEMLSFDPPRQLIATWAEPNWGFETVLNISLAAETSGTRIHLVHSGWDRAGDEQKRLMRAHTAGWTQHLRNLRAYAEARAGAQDTDGS